MPKGTLIRVPFFVSVSIRIYLDFDVKGKRVALVFLRHAGMNTLMRESITKSHFIFDVRSSQPLRNCPHSVYFVFVRWTGIATPK